jgi:DNA-binding transcriptional MerR regulator
MIDDSVLSNLERQYEAGLTSSALIDVCGAHGIQLSEATLRKYVQLGLLPRSKRVGQKGKHLGSRGVYPVHAIRQLLRIKEMMAESYTIEEIRRDFLFVRTDIEQLEQTLGCIFKALSRVLEQRGREQGRRRESRPGSSRREEGGEQGSALLSRELGEVKKEGRQLVARLSSIEARLMRPARLSRAGVNVAAAQARAS